jgi:hypothetical protein
MARLTARTPASRALPRFTALPEAPELAGVEEIRAITRRYIVPEEVEGYIARWPDLRTIVTIVPARIVSWSAGG